MSPRYKLGHYRLIRRIGVGGMAEVYEAEQGGTQGFGKRLALKVLLPQLQRDQEVVKSFIDEATIVASLSHPNIVPVYDFGQIDGTYYLAMEFQDGWDLAEVLRRCAERGLALPVPAAAYVGHELARALDHIHRHERQIVHRDVTPHNVFVDRAGQVKLGDFGVAKAASRLAKTEQGQIKGKLAYLSPEQVAGDPVTARTDVYAAGLVLFEMLTGGRYNAARREVDLFASAGDPSWRPPSSLRPEAHALDRVLADALQKHPTMRTRDAALLAEQLERFLTHAPYDAHALATFVARFDEEPAAGGNEIPVGSLGVGRRATEPPIARASGTLRLPGEGVVPEEITPEEVTQQGVPQQGVTRQGVTRQGVTELRAEVLGRPRARLLLLVLLSAIVIGGAAGAYALLGRDARPAPGGERLAIADGAVAAIPADSSTTTVETTTVETTAASPADATAATEVPDGADASPRVTRPATIKQPRRSKTARRRRPRTSKKRPLRQPDATIARPARPSQPPANKTADAPKEPGAATRQARLARVDRAVAAARRKGLFPGDDRPFDRLRAGAGRAARSGQGAEASVSALERHVDRFAIDQPFIKRKLSRLERAIAAAPAAERQRLQAASQRVLRLVLGDRLVAASGQISRLLGQLRR